MAEICEEFGEPVASNHGATIPEVMENLRYETVEFAAFFEQNGKKICESTINCPTMTILSESDQKLVLQCPGGTMVHNHPHEPVAFSPEDLISLGAGVCDRSIVVTATVSYFMEVPKRRACVPPSLIRWLGRRFYRGSTNAEASFNFCMAVANHLDWKFGMMVPVPVEAREDAGGEMLVAVYDATLNGIVLQIL